MRYQFRWSVPTENVVLAPQQLRFSSAARDTLPRMGTPVTSTGSGHRSRPVVAALTILYTIELVGILCTAMVVASLGRTHLGRGARLLALSLVAAAALVGWRAIRLLAGQRRLSVTELAVQSAILIGAIALATQRPTVGAVGVVVAAGVLAACWRRGAG